MRNDVWTKPIPLGPEYSLQLDGKNAGAVGYHRVELEEEGEDLARALHNIVRGLELAFLQRFPDLVGVRRHVTVTEYSGPRPVWVVRVWAERPE